jgi:hypothetical protein
MIDLVHAIVGVEATQHQAKTVEQLVYHRQQDNFAELLATYDQFLLGHLIDGIDTIQLLSRRVCRDKRSRNTCAMAA